MRTKTLMEGNVAAGSLFSTLTSAGAAGLAGTTTAGVAAGAGAVGGGVAAGVGGGYLTSAAPGSQSTDPTQPGFISDKNYYSSARRMDSACLGDISFLQTLLLIPETYRHTRMAHYKSLQSQKLNCLVEEKSSKSKINIIISV